MPGGGGTQVEADGTPREHAAHCVDVDRGLKIIKVPIVLQYSTGRPISWRTSVGLTWIWDVPPSCPSAQPLLPTSHQPRQNQAEGGTAKIIVNPTQLSEQMPLPVVVLELSGSKKETSASLVLFPGKHRFAI